MSTEHSSMMLTLMVTLGCNSKCAHCCLACSPSKLALSMDESEMLTYIEQAHDSDIRSVTFTGGEPMLVDFDLPMALANFYGMQIDIRTNAYWARTYDEALGELRRLQLQGLTRLGLSYDNYHAKTIPSDCIANALKAARELCMYVYLDWIGLEAYRSVLECLQMNECELRYVGPPLRVGSATKLGQEYFSRLYTKDLMRNSSCGSDVLLTLFPGGFASLHSCCWVNPVLIRKIGENGWVKQLEEEMENSPMVTFLREFGVAGLVEKARRERPELLRSYYSHHCEACYDLLGPLFPEELPELPRYLWDFEGQIPVVSSRDVL